MGVKSLGFDKAFTVQAKAALAAMFRRLLLNGLLRSGGGRKEIQFAIGQNSIHIEKQQFEFLGARLAVWHDADFSRAMNYSGLCA